MVILSNRRLEQFQAEAIVSESAAFMSWMRSLQAVDSIRDYRKSANEIEKNY